MIIRRSMPIVLIGSALLAFVGTLAPTVGNAASKAHETFRPVSAEVRRACANDYFQHCSMHPVGTPAVRKCMRAVGPRLSKGCIGALVAAGEVTPADRKRYKSANTKHAKR
jgi:hypothetical protein